MGKIISARPRRHAPHLCECLLERVCESMALAKKTIWQRAAHFPWVSHENNLIENQLTWFSTVQLRHLILFPSGAPLSSLGLFYLQPPGAPLSASLPSSGLCPLAAWCSTVQLQSLLYVCDVCDVCPCLLHMFMLRVSCMSVVFVCYCRVCMYGVCYMSCISVVFVVFVCDCRGCMHGVWALCLCVVTVCLLVCELHVCCVGMWLLFVCVLYELYVCRVCVCLLFVC